MDIWQKICSFDNLYNSWLEVKRKGKSGGIDNVTIQDFETFLHKNLQSLQTDLSQNKYIPEPYKQIAIPKSNDEKRIIGISAVKDKIIQHAVKFAIEPLFEADFLNCSYAYRKNKSARKAINAVTTYVIEQKRRWVLTCDIDNFFDNINHEVLFKLLSEKIDDERIINLIKLWIKIGRVTKKGEWIEKDKGIPQGAVISPLLSNIYLHQLDSYMRKNKFCFVRYGDNFIVMAYTRDDVQKAISLCTRLLERQLYLQLNPDVKINRITDGFEFLGIRFEQKQKGIAPEKYKKITETISKIGNEWSLIPLEEGLNKIREEVLGWRNYYGELVLKEQLQKLDVELQTQIKTFLKKKLINKEITKSNLNAFKPALFEILFISSNRYEDINKCVDNIIKELLDELKSLEYKGNNTKSSTSLSPPLSMEKKGGLMKHTDENIEKKIQAKKQEFYKTHSKSYDLVISTRGVFVGKSGKFITVRKEGRVINKVSTLNLKHLLVTCEGVGISSDVIKYCMEENIKFDFISFTGQPLASLHNPMATDGTIALLQLNALQNSKAQLLVKKIVGGKIKNQSYLIKYYLKHRKKEEHIYKSFRENVYKIESLVNKVETIESDDIETLRGKLFAVEGHASSIYWQTIQNLLPANVNFEGRKRKGAEDLVNSLLNYGYGILYTRIWNALNSVGLNPYISFLHTSQKGKPTLSFDLIEEFRQHIVDRTVISMLLKGEKLVVEKGRLTDNTKKKLVNAILKRLNSRLKFRGEEIFLNDVIRIQALELVKYLKGEINSYRPFTGKW